MAGVSLLEMMVAVVILAIIAAIAAPNFNQLTRRSRLTAASNELVGAVSAVLSGERYVSPLIAESTNASGGLQPPASEVVLDPLSDREREIIALMGRGHSQAEIARALLISVRTVETHCERAINKLGLGGMKDLRRHAIQDVRR